MTGTYWRQVLGVAGITLALASCGQLDHLSSPVFLAGSDAAAQLDFEAGDIIAAYYPGIPIGRAKCPVLLDLTGGRSARCTIPVAGGTLRVDIASGGPGKGLLRDVDAVVVRKEAERQIVQLLELRHGIRFNARCEGAPVRVVPVGGTIPCTVAAPGVRTRTLVAFATTRTGRMGLPMLYDVAGRERTMLGAEVAERREGGVTIDGPAAERFFRAIAGGRQHDELVRRKLLGPAHCSRRVVLTPDRHARCTVLIGTRTLSYDLRFDRGRGFVFDADRFVVIVPGVAELVRRTYERALRDNGQPWRLRVECDGGPVVLAEPGGDLSCKALGKKWWVRIWVQGLGANGEFRLNRDAIPVLEGRI